MITLPSIPPNSAIESFYRRSIDDMMRDMRKDIKTSVIARYRSELAMDGIIDWMGHIVDSIVDKWTNRLNTLAPTIAQEMEGRTRKNYDKRIHSLLKRRGMIVNLQMSQKVREQAEIALQENIGLIKSVGVEYLDKVRSAVWRSVKDGYDMQSLIEQLKHIDGVTARRAENIAKDQVGKYNQAVEDARAQELGITRAIWLHSSASKVPRPDHVAANGTEYDIEKGCLISGEYIKPAISKINCHCRKKLIIELTPQHKPM